MESDSIVVIAELPGVHRIWAFHNLVVVVWTGKPTGDAASMIARVSDRLLARGPATKLSYLHFVPNKLELPDAAARAGFVDLAHSQGARTGCVALILDGAGFWASAIRGFVTSIRVIAPRTIDLRIHSEMSELLEWFPEEHAQRTGVQLESAELLRQLEHVRRNTPQSRAPEKTL